jgi:hypothetical protein
LRREVPFTLKEIATISKNMNISLDNIIGIETPKSRPFQLILPEFLSPQENDFQMLTSYLDFLKILEDAENTEMGIVTNMLPQDLFSGFYYLTKFSVFTWNCHYNESKMQPFHELEYSDRLIKGFKAQFRKSRNLKKSYYIFDNQIFRHFANNINYFRSIRLLETEDVLKIKEDLFQLLDYLENIAITGQFKETGNEVHIYISDIDITSNYCYMEADDIQFSLIKTFILTSVTSLDKTTFEKMKAWVHSFIKISSLITVAGEKQRIMYFDTQRKIISEI